MADGKRPDRDHPGGQGEDPLLKRLRDAQAQVRAGDRALGKVEPTAYDEAQEVYEDAVEEVRYWTRFARRLRQVLETLWFSYLRPISWVMTPIALYAWAGYKALFQRFAFDSNGQFRRHRAAGAIISMAVATLFIGYQTLWNAIPFAIKFGYDAVAINAFSYEDTLVFSKPEWVEGEIGVLSVFACRRYPCEGQADSIEFRMRDSIYLDVWRTLTKLEPHDPGELAGAFLSEENACNFKAYGVRVKYLGFYPYLFDATCRPINGENSRSVLDEMKALRFKKDS